MPAEACVRVSGRERASASSSFIDDLLPQRIAKLLSDDTRRDIGKAARGKSDKDAHGFHGVSGLCQGCKRGVRNSGRNLARHNQSTATYGCHELLRLLNGMMSV